MCVFNFNNNHLKYLKYYVSIFFNTDTPVMSAMILNSLFPE